MDFSYVQEKILTKLLKSKKLRYSQAAPDDDQISNDLYNYHLQFLVEKGFINKDNGYYFLTKSGKKAVQVFDSKGNLKDLFKVSILAYIIKDQKLLLQERLRHPYQGDIGVLSGKVNPGEKIEQAAKRKTKEETGLLADFKLVGVRRSIRRDSKEKIIEDSFYHVCVSDNPQGELVEQTQFGKNFWSSFVQAIKQQRKNITASKCIEKELKRLQKKDYSWFYFQEDIKLETY